MTDGRHPRGYVGFALIKPNACRLRNLKVTAAGGRILVDGVHSLDFAGEQRDVPVKDQATAGTVWKGRFRRNEKGRDTDQGDVDCADIPERNFKSVGSDPDFLDADGDGIACES